MRYIYSRPYRAGKRHRNHLKLSRRNEYIPHIYFFGHDSIMAIDCMLFMCGRDGEVDSIPFHSSPFIDKSLLAYSLFRQSEKCSICNRKLISIAMRNFRSVNQNKWMDAANEHGLGSSISLICDARNNIAALTLFCVCVCEHEHILYKLTYTIIPYSYIC